MTSIAYNLTRKIEWMGRKLRWIDDAADIENWASAMRELNLLLKEVEIKEYKDNWKPWSTGDRRGDILGMKDSRKRENVPQEGLDDSSCSELTINVDKRWSRPPRVEVEGDA